MSKRSSHPDDSDQGLQLFAIDPGGTTGWAMLWIPTANLIVRDIHVFEDVEFDCGQLTGPEELQAVKLREMLRRMEGPVICEDFILRQFRQDRALLAPVRVTAMLEYILYAHSDPQRNPFRKQQPSLAKSSATDERLKEWGMWEKGAPHARDAIRHAVTFLRRAKSDLRLRAWAWPHTFGPSNKAP